MAYQLNTALTIPERFRKLYEHPFKYKTPVAVERAPFIRPDRRSQIDYLRWISSQQNVVPNDREHIEEIIDIFSDLPFDITCTGCKKEKATYISLPFQYVDVPAWDRGRGHYGKADVQYRRFPYFCDECSDKVGRNRLRFNINFDDPLRKRNDTYLKRRMILRDLKALLYYGLLLDGPAETIDPARVMSEINSRKNNGKERVICISNMVAKEIADRMVHLKRKRMRRWEKSSQMNLFDRPDIEQPDTFIPGEYRERDIIILTR